MYKEKNKDEKIMPIVLVIFGYHGNGAFRAIINLNTKFSTGINITRIFRLAHVQCKKNNGYIMWNTVMEPIGYMINNICAGIFIGLTHEGKIKFRVLTHGFPLPPPR